MAHGLRPRVPRDQDAEQQCEARGPRRGEGPSEHPLVPETASAEAPGRPGETLRASSVSRSFEGVQALRDVTLELRRREVVGLIGPNGAGKSTLVNVLTGFDRPDEGSVELAGSEITAWSPQRRARAGLARTFQHSRSFRGLTVRENVEVAALGAGTGPREARRRADRLLDLLGLAAVAGRGAAELAHGDERRLGVARVLATDPSFVLLDEPAAGLPDAEVPEFAEVVRSLLDENDAGMLLIDHNMALVMGVCDRIHVLDQGRTLAAGTPEEIRGNLDVAAAYLGETAVHETGG
ncbi:MAG: ABC transporter ATP-binding protein [Actinobacteria bacterium]|nr:MAG: ABC transporter ATP-binding protein [Actinomycetota bacterium]